MSCFPTSIFCRPFPGCDLTGRDWRIKLWKTAKDAQNRPPNGKKWERRGIIIIKKANEQLHKLHSFALRASLLIHVHVVSRNLQGLVAALIRAPGRQVPFLPHVQWLIFKYIGLINIQIPNAPEAIRLYPCVRFTSLISFAARGESRRASITISWLSFVPISKSTFIILNTG